MTPWRRLALAALAALALLGCSPTVKGAGPASASPRLDGTAIVTADGTSLPMRSWLPKDGAPKAVVLALHGMNDYSFAFEGPGEFLSRQGIAVYAYDQRGFGQSAQRGFWPGEKTLAEDARAVAVLLRERHPGVPLFLLGESMGGAVAMVAMTGPAPPPVDGVILSAPAVWSRDEMNLFMRASLWLSSHTLPWLTLSGRGLQVKASDNIEMLRALGRDPMIIKETRIDVIKGVCDIMDSAQAAAPRLKARLLVLYGEHDEVVPPEPSFRMMNALPGPAERQVKAVYGQGWHLLLRDLQAEVVLGDIRSWIEAPDAPLPSGADGRARTILAGG